MPELRDLENETAEVLLNQIKAQSANTGTAGLLQLAQAYAAVVDAAPGPRRQSGRAVVG